MRPCMLRFAWAQEPIHLNGLPCPGTHREDIPALLWKSQPAREPRFPVRLRFLVWAACH
ncbi:unnamed protein product [Staurois parvus]|uniref:Uncharacterized protein n=1 Tax=Staurois parvus TaxID=386267 RepID=A0ABN9BYK6_9NEOB|nr:unnamed protein product [Staurois parvus]